MPPILTLVCNHYSHWTRQAASTSTCLRLTSRCISRNIGAGGPILLYLGNEGAIDGFYNFTGALFEHAEALGAYAVFVEHRYYGASQPFAKSTNKNLRYLTVDQAMADYAWLWGSPVPVILHKL